MHELEVFLNNSTTVRSFYKGHLLRALGKAWPDATVAWLRRQFLKPQGRASPAVSLPGEEQVRVPVQDATHHVPVTVAGCGPLVVLVHGWAGSSGQLGPLRDQLLQEGFTVAWFDAPGHGRQPGDRAHIGQFVEILHSAQKALGRPHGIVGHSLGGLAATLACSRGARTDKLLLLSPLPSFDFALDHYQATLGFDERQRQSLARGLEQLTGFSRAEASLTAALPLVRQEVMIIHDCDDRRVPATHSRKLSTETSNLEYVETRELGHQHILASPQVLHCAVEWLLRGLDRSRMVPALAGTTASAEHGSHSVTSAVRRARSPEPVSRPGPAPEVSPAGALRNPACSPVAPGR